MDPRQNPFAPGAGTQPPQLAGREEILNDVEITLERIRLGRPSRSQVLVGLRGVGKTVLLNRIREMASARGFEAILIEAHEDKSLPAMLIPPIRRLLLKLDTRENLSEKTKLGLRVLRSFIGRFRAKLRVGDLAEVELGVDPERGVADSGDLEIDLTDLFLAVAEAAQDRGVSIAIQIDELQYLHEQEFSALIMALHQVSQRNLPLVLFAAGLPIVMGHAGKAKSYAERLFAFPPIGQLLPEAARRALEAPVMAQGVAFTAEALDEMVRMTECYPYFLQQWGYEVWNVASQSPITKEDVDAATIKAIRQLDDSFFRVRFDRLTRREKEFLFAMVALGGSTQRSGEIAERLGVKPSAIGPLRSTLITKGMIYSPSHGDNAFTVPLFDAFLKRQTIQNALPQAAH